MSLKSFSPFGTTRELEGQIDEFLDKVSEGGLVFRAGLDGYLDEKWDVAGEKLEQISVLERRCDALRRSIETTLYTEMLIPESRSDVLQLLSDIDDLLDGFKHSLMGIVVERPDVPPQYRDPLRELGEQVIEASEYTVRAARAFFRDAPTIRDHVHKIGFFEEESDRAALRLNREVFASDLPLAHKMHLRDAIRFIAEIADNAEDCGDRMTIFAIKRSL